MPWQAVYRPRLVRRYAHAADLAKDLRAFSMTCRMALPWTERVRERMAKWASASPICASLTSIGDPGDSPDLLLGGAVTLVYDKMQDLSARVRDESRDQDFTEIQFLLILSGGSNEHLKKNAKVATDRGAVWKQRQQPPLGGDELAATPEEEGRRLRRAGRRADHA